MYTCIMSIYNRVYGYLPMPTINSYICSTYAYMSMHTIHTPTYSLHTYHTYSTHANTYTYIHIHTYIAMHTHAFTYTQFTYPDTQRHTHAYPHTIHIIYASFIFKHIYHAYSYRSSYMHTCTYQYIHARIP